MWNIVRILLFVLAVAGFVGQSSAYASPVLVLEATSDMSEMDCAEMMVMADEDAGGALSPCSKMTPDCIAKIGSAAAVAPMSTEPTLERPFAPRAMRFSAIDVVREGAGPLPLKNPPKRLS